ncbi:MAG: hypothetical protein AAFY15_05650 [Cyanobacteria bacterium J06648_11]
MTSASNSPDSTPNLTPVAPDSAAPERAAQPARSLLVLTIGLVIWGLIALCIAAIEPASRKSSIDIWLFIGGFSLGAGFLLLSHRD